MFHVVVDSDETASRLLEQMGKELGRITLMPLNQLSPRLLDFGEVGSDAIPIVKLLDYNQKFEKAIQQVIPTFFNLDFINRLLEEPYFVNL